MKHAAIVLFIIFTTITAFSQESRSLEIVRLVDSIAKGISTYSIKYITPYSVYDYPGSDTNELSSTFPSLKKKRLVKNNAGLRVKAVVDDVQVSEIKNPIAKAVYMKGANNQYTMYEISCSYKLSMHLEFCTKDTTYIVPLPEDHDFTVKEEGNKYEFPEKANYNNDAYAVNDIIAWKQNFETTIRSGWLVGDFNQLLKELPRIKR